MKRFSLTLVVLMLLLAPSLGSANPNGVGSGTFDAQCGGACHGDADMNRSSTATVVVNAPDVAYEGLLTSVSVTVSDIETTTTGLLGFFLLSDLSGASDTPADAGWTIVSNSEGGTENYVEAVIASGQTQHTVHWTLRAPPVGLASLHAAIHHGSQDGSDAPFFGASSGPATIDVREVPEDLPRLAANFEPTVRRNVGESTTMTVATEHVNQVTVEWKVSSGEVNTATVTSVGENTWSFALPASLQPVQIEWRAHLEGEGPDQTTPWFQLQSEEPSWSVDENAAYVQSVAMLLVFMVAFLSLQRRSSAPSKNFDPFDSTEDEEVA
ncbi:MAG: hypothetical protein L7R83_06145 [Candidatus Poseidonia sp.]|nr:hypothetical protein [Poseidonia sp.]